MISQPSFGIWGWTSTQFTFLKRYNWNLEFDGSFGNSCIRSFLKQNCSSPCAEFAEGRGQIDKHYMAGSPLYFQFNSAKWKDLNWSIRPKNKLMWYLTIFTDSKKLNQSGQTKSWCGIFFLRNAPGNAPGLRPRLPATPEKFKNAALFLITRHRIQNPK